MAFSHAEPAVHTGQPMSGDEGATPSHPVFDAPPQSEAAEDIQDERPSQPSRNNTRRRRR